jgi:hypothetical protein
MMTLSGMNGAIRKGVVSLLRDHLPNRTKRLVFLASLAARLKGSDTFDSETLHKLNRVMELGKTDSALKLPYELSRAIWQGKTSYEILDLDFTSSSFNQARKEEMSQRIINAMPSWLRYGSDKDIFVDVNHLLDNKSLVLGS